MECSNKYIYFFFIQQPSWWKGYIISDTPGVARTVLQTVLEFTISTIPDLPKKYLKHWCSKTVKYRLKLKLREHFPIYMIIVKSYRFTIPNGICIRRMAGLCKVVKLERGGGFVILDILLSLHQFQQGQGNWLLATDDSLVPIQWVIFYKLNIFCFVLTSLIFFSKS